MSSWKTKKLGELLTIRHGRNQRAVESPSGQYPILGTGGEIGRATKSLYNKPSVLIGRKGTIDKPRYIDTPFWTVDTLFYSEIKPECSPKFLYYVFNTINWKWYNEASGVPSLSASTISSIKVNTPSKPEQERIVAVLEVWDKYIEKLERKIELKERLKEGLMQQLLTGEQRLPDFSNKWNRYTFKQVCGIKRGGSPRPIEDFIVDNSQDGYPWLRIGDISTGARKVSATSQKIRREGLSKTTLVRKGDFILSNSMSFGRPYIMDIDACIHDGWLALRNIDDEIVDPWFLYYLLLSKSMQNTFKNMSAGSGVQNLKKETVEKIGFNIPPIAEQRAIVSILDNVDTGIESLKFMQGQIKRQKKYLLKNLITGTIRTPENLKPYEARS